MNFFCFAVTLVGHRRIEWVVWVIFGLLKAIPVMVESNFVKSEFFGCVEFVCFSLLLVQLSISSMVIARKKNLLNTIGFLTGFELINIVFERSR